MKYNNVLKAKFINRPNRFIANVDIDGEIETVHVKNTGRCRELLFKDVEVILEKSDNPNRKTKYDLIAVNKENLGWVNIDSQAPNKIVGEWISKQDYTYIKPEYKYGNSRIDFYMEKDDQKFLMEVKGCTLEIDGVGYFPDAPTERGVKHLKELTKAVTEGYECIIAFAIPMEKVYEVLPNDETHPEFGVALKEAYDSGVSIWYMPCIVSEDTLEVVDCIERSNKINTQKKDKICKIEIYINRNIYKWEIYKTLKWKYVKNIYVK